jgi:hypothetical protein
MNEIPNIKLIDDRLEGAIPLPVWKTFQGSQDTQENYDGVFEISVGGDMVMDKPTITADHINAYNYLITHSEQIQKSILVRLLADYKNLQVEYGYDEDEANEFMPDVDNVEQFKKLIRLSRIHLLNVSKDGFAYVGYEVSCSWDDEHGLGFMTHKDRVVDFGGSDTSFLTWVARQDL